MVRELLLPAGEQAVRPQRDAVGDGLRRAAGREQLLRELAGPPDRLDGRALEVAEDAPRRRRRIAPAVALLEAGAPCELERFLERERLLGDAEQLDVGDVVGRATRDAARQDDFDYTGREPVGDALCQCPQLFASAHQPEYAKVAA